MLILPTAACQSEHTGIDFFTNWVHRWIIYRTCFRVHVLGALSVCVCVWFVWRFGIGAEFVFVFLKLHVVTFVRTCLRSRQQWSQVNIRHCNNCRDGTEMILKISSSFFFFFLLMFVFSCPPPPVITWRPAFHYTDFWKGFQSSG